MSLDLPAVTPRRRLGASIAAVVAGFVGPLWYPIALLVSALPCIALGAWLGARRA